MIWSVYQIRLLLHYYAFPGDFTDGTAVARDSMCEEMNSLGLLGPSLATASQVWQITDKGRCFIEDGLLKTPLPVWGIPR